MLSRNRVAVIVALLVILLAAAMKLLMPGGEKESARRGGGTGRGGAAAARSVVVNVRAVAGEVVADTIRANGTVRAARDIELKCEAAGRVTGLYFTEGKRVRKGQLLLRINNDDLRAQLKKAQAAAALAQERERRQKELLGKEAISTEDYQSSVKDLQSSRADIELIEAQIAKTEIRAPFDGVIGITGLSQGSYVTPGAKIANLVSSSELIVECAVPERYAPLVGPGTPVTYTVVGSPKGYRAEVIARDVRIDEATRSVGIKARCVDPDSSVVAGSFAHVECAVTNHTAILVPAEALIADVNGYKAYLVRGGAATPVAVTTGYRDAERVEVVSGLTPGDSVVVSGAFMLRPGMPVALPKAK